MCKIKFSYERDAELTRFIEWLGDMAEKVEREPARGRFKRAYIMLKPLVDSDKK